MFWLRGGFIIFIIAILGGMPTAGGAHEETVTVTVTDEGFSPREVTVDSSSSVLFVNKDEVPHWPASNPHPRHDDYPEFDPTKAIEPGEWWLFKPTKPGTWGYHDHLNPHRKGTLIVTAEQNTEAPDATVQDAQPGFGGRVKNTLTSWWSACTAKVRGIFARAPRVPVISAAAFRELPEKEQYAYVEAYAKAKGLQPTWQFAKGAFTTGANASSLGGRAHDVAHFIGGLVYKGKGLGGLSICDPTFAFGCYHGFTESAFAKSLDPLAQVAKQCETLGVVLSGPWSSCIHGIGHGVASYYNSTDLEPALSTCNVLGEGATYCHDGVFMEFAISAPDSFYNRERPLSPCDTVSLPYQMACGRNILAAMSSRFGLAPLEVTLVCITANAPFTNSCIDSYGFAVVHGGSSSGMQIAAACAGLGQSGPTAQCAGAAAGELVFQNFPDWQTQAPAVCRSLPPADQPGCFTRLQQTVDNYKR